MAGLRKQITQIVNMKGSTPIVMVTAYDASMARLVDQAVDSILVGDSMGNVVQGRGSTIPVTLDEIIYHTQLVCRGSEQALIVADLPFMSYQPSVSTAVESAGRLLKEGGAQVVKLEGGQAVVPQVMAIVEAGIPLVGHLGVTPQHIHKLGGYGKQGKTEDTAQRIIEDALAMEAAGASLLVLENIPHELAKKVTGKLKTTATIGIGAGPHCDGQVQVFHDLVGLDLEFTPRHAVRYVEAGQAISGAVAQYAGDVRSGKFVSK